MIHIDVWRARIGLYNLRIRRSSDGRVEILLELRARLSRHVKEKHASEAKPNEEEEVAAAGGGENVTSGVGVEEGRTRGEGGHYEEEEVALNKPGGNVREDGETEQREETGQGGVVEGGNVKERGRERETEQEVAVEGRECVHEGAGRGGETDGGGGQGWRQGGGGGGKGNVKGGKGGETEHRGIVEEEGRAGVERGRGSEGQRQGGKNIRGGGGVGTGMKWMSSRVLLRMLIMFLFLRLIVSGDIELNPGPVLGEWECIVH